MMRVWMHWVRAVSPAFGIWITGVTEAQESNLGGGTSNGARLTVSASTALTRKEKLEHSRWKVPIDKVWKSASFGQS